MQARPPAHLCAHGFAFVNSPIFAGKSRETSYSHCLYRMNLFDQGHIKELHSIQNELGIAIGLTSEILHGIKLDFILLQDVSSKLKNIFDDFISSFTPYLLWYFPPDSTYSCMSSSHPDVKDLNGLHYTSVDGPRRTYLYELSMGIHDNTGRSTFEDKYQRLQILC